MRSTLLACACALAAGPSFASEFLVTSAADDGPGSLRAAVAAANAQPGPDTIRLQVGEIILSAGTLLVTDDLTVLGIGPNQTRLVNAAPVTPVADYDRGRVFLLRGTVERQLAVTLRELSFEQGHTRGTVDGNGIVTDYGEGGAVRSEYTDLVVEACSFVANHSASDGGGLWQYEGDLTLLRTQFASNVAEFHGGGLHVTGGDARLERVRFVGNEAPFGGAIATIDTGTRLSLREAQLGYNRAGHTGGAGYLAVSALDIASTTVNENVSGQPQGAGLYLVAPLDAPGTPMQIANSTFSGNGTPADVGASAGAAITLARGRLLLRNSTVYGNPVAAPGTPPRVGGGIFVAGGDNHLEMESVLVAAGDVVRDIESEGDDNSIRARHSLMQVAPVPGTLNAGDSENLFGVDPRLGPLATNGGFTWTHAIAADSPARDRGDNIAPRLSTDQRGVDATLGLRFHRYYGRPDIGAYEYYGEDTIFYSDFDDH